MIQDKEKWHYLAVKILSTSKILIINGDLHCLNCLHSFRTKTKLNLHEEVCANKDFCSFVKTLRY